VGLRVLQGTGHPTPDDRVLAGGLPAGLCAWIVEKFWGPKELQRPSRRWAEKRFLDIRYWIEPHKGGHFAALEQPELFVDEVRAFFRLVR
jgi:hypothetical protein